MVKLFWCVHTQIHKEKYIYIYVSILYNKERLGNGMGVCSLSQPVVAWVTMRITFYMWCADPELFLFTNSTLIVLSAWHHSILYSSLNWWSTDALLLSAIEETRIDWFFFFIIIFFFQNGCAATNIIHIWLITAQHHGTGSKVNEAGSVFQLSSSSQSIWRKDQGAQLAGGEEKIFHYSLSKHGLQHYK